MEIKKQKGKEVLYFTINPRKLMNKTKKGGEIFSILAPYLISIGVVATSKLLSDLAQIIKKSSKDNKKLKEVSSEHFKKKYGSLSKFLDNFVLTKEMVLAVTAPLIYKDVIKTIPNEKLSSYLLDKAEFVAEKYPRRLDYKFDKKYTYPYLTHGSRKKDELIQIAKSIGVATKVNGISKQNNSKTKNQLANDIYKSIHGSTNILQSVDEKKMMTNVVNNEVADRHENYMTKWNRINNNLKGNTASSTVNLLQSIPINNNRERTNRYSQDLSDLSSFIGEDDDVVNESNFFTRDNLQNLTLKNSSKSDGPSLRMLAKGLKIKGYSNMKKRTIIDKIISVTEHIDPTTLQLNFSDLIN